MQPAVAAICRLVEATPGRSCTTSSRPFCSAVTDAVTPSAVLTFASAFAASSSHHLQVALLRSQYQSRIPVAVRGVHIGLCGDKGVHHLQVAPQRRPDQRCLAIVILDVHVGVCGQQGLHHFGMVALGRQEQRGRAITSPGIHRGRCGQQGLHHVQAACQRGVHQGGGAVGHPAFTSAFAASKARTTSKWFSRVASINAVEPSVFSAFTSALAASNAFTTRR